MNLGDRRILAACVLVILAGADAASAQTSSTQARPGPKRGREFMIGGLIAGPMSVGSASAELPGGSGTPGITLFRVKNTLGIGFGVESNIGFELRKALWMEVSGGWTRSSVRSRIEDDFENAPDETISIPMSRFVVEGAVVRYFRDRGASAWFVRFDAGWMRETAGGNTLTGDGIIAGGGLGLRRWWRTSGKGSVKRIGLRIEGRAAIRSGGISVGEKAIRFGPAGTAHLVFGY
jgi:hypothetical protein